jgi:hypothetical protein
MNNFFKILLMVLLFINTIKSSGQIFRVHAGLNLSNMIYKTYGNRLEIKPGFNLGSTVEIPPNDFYSFEMGLILSSKGFQISDKVDLYEYQEKLNLLYLDIPLTAKVAFDIGSCKIYGKFGPYMGWGISGKWKYEERNNGETVKSSMYVSWGTGGDLKRFDIGLTVGAGIEVKSMLLNLFYGLGLANIASYTGGGNIIKNRILEVSVGYKLGGK